MFVGIAFAATSTTTLKVTLNSDTLIVGEDTYTVTGTIKKPNGKLITDPVNVELQTLGGVKVVDTVAINGAFTLEVAKADITANTKYQVKLTGAQFVDPDDHTAEEGGTNGPELPLYANPATLPTVSYRYNIVWDSTPALKYNDTNKMLTGKVVNSKNVGVAGVVVTFIDTDTTRSNGMFVLDITTVNVAGEQDVLVGAMPTATINVAGIAFHEVSAVKSVAHSAFPVSLGLVVENTDGNSVAANALTTYTLTGVKIKDWTGSAEVTDDSTLSDGYFTKLTIAGDDLPGTFTFGSKGTLTISVSYNGGEFVGSTTVDVVDPAELNLVVTPSTTPSVAHAGFTLDVDAYLKDGTRPASLKYSVLGSIITEVKDVEVAADNFTTAGISPKMGGKITLQVTAYNDEDEVVGTATQVIDVDGYVYAITPAEVTVNGTTNITVVVKTVDGAFVNNANVTLDNAETGNFSVVASSSNINNGTYILKDVKFATVDAADLTIATLGGTTMATGTVAVNGENVYTVAPTSNKITAGVATDLTVKVTEDGEIVEGLDQDATFYVDGVAIDDANIEYNAETEVYMLSDVVVTTTDEPVYIEVKTDTDTKVGKAQMAVSIPVVTITPSTLTNLYKESVKITVTDPLTGKALAADLTLTSEDLNALIKAGEVTVVNNAAVDGKLFTGDDTYEFDITVKPVDTDADEKVAPELKITKLTVDGNDLDVEIPFTLQDASLSLDNTSLFIGYANRVAFTLKNARGEALAERKVYQNGTEIGITDDNGGLLYSVTPAATGKITFTAESDVTGKFATTEVIAKQDLTGPVITVTVPETTTANSVVLTGTIADETRVASVYVNNVPVAIIPGTSTTFVYEVALHDGANTISVIALDANGNGTPKILTVTKTAPVAKTVAITIGKVDAAAGLDVAAYLEPGRTMVPLAFISRTLGGTAEWDAVTNKVTINLNGKTAVLTFGSKTAVVDGVPTTLYVAPTAKSGRTFVAVADLAKLLGATTQWNEATKTATVILP
jgi:hypothetical protein